MLRYFRCHRDKKNGENTGVLDILRGRLLIKNTISDDSTKMAGHTRGFQAPSFCEVSARAPRAESEPPSRSATEEAEVLCSGPSQCTAPGQGGDWRQQGQFIMLVLCFCRDGKPYRGPLSCTSSAVEPGAPAGITLPVP